MELGESQLLLMKMIVGHGIDIEELASIQNAVEKREGFAQRVLTDKEMERFASLKGRRQVEYLACLLYTSPSPRDRTRSRMPSSA